MGQAFRSSIALVVPARRKQGGYAIVGILKFAQTETAFDPEFIRVLVRFRRCVGQEVAAGVFGHTRTNRRPSRLGGSQGVPRRWKDAHANKRNKISS